MSKETRSYSKMREDQELSVISRARGRYTVLRGGDTWTIWRGADGRWLGESKEHPGKLISASTFTTARYDLRMGHFVSCASAGPGN